MGVSHFKDIVFSIQISIVSYILFRCKYCSYFAVFRLSVGMYKQLTILKW